MEKNQKYHPVGLLLAEKGLFGLLLAEEGLFGQQLAKESLFGQHLLYFLENSYQIGFLVF